MYEDFNFDGNKDFAIMDGQNSCYHGPSYRIYLAADKGFSFNEAFTRLARNIVECLRWIMIKRKFIQ